MPTSPLSLAAEIVGQAAATSRSHPLRSSLGALAVTVAVATLTLVSTAVDGLGLLARQSAARVFGSDSFLLAQTASPGQLSRRELERKLERNPPLDRSDLRFLESYAGDRVIYAATAQRTADVTSGGRKFENAAVCGTGHRLPEIRDLGLESGRFFDQEEERQGAQVAVLGADLVDQLFPGGEALGRSVRIAGRGFRVIGLQGRLGTSGGVSLDRYAWIPLPAYERAFGAAKTLQISARPPEGRGVELAEDRARATLRARHALRPGEEDDFDLLAPEAARSFVLSLARRIGAAAPILSGMALLAAIVVVTNTTLVSVTQRSFEIGVRRALGATRGRILAEVLAEATLISLLGGLCGAGFVALLARLLAGPLGIELAVAPATLLTALVASAVSGLAAGFYPARRAARLDVIAALRME